MRTALALLVVLIGAHAAPLSAQTPAPAAAAPAPPVEQAPAVPPPAAGTPPQPAENYIYQADGRRDPFLNLLGTGAEPKELKRGEGPAGLLVAEISVRGVMKSRGSLVAMIQGPDNKTYVIHQGDKLADGVVKSVTPDGLVITQEVNDPLSIVKQREVRKLLRSREDAKERL